MKKVFKRFLNILFYFSVSLLIFLSFILIISQTERFRNFLHNLVESELKKSLGGEIYLGKFYGNIFTGLGVNGFSVSIEGKTFIKALCLELKYNPFSLIRGGYSFYEITIYKPEVYLIRGKDGKWNFQKVFKTGEGEEKSAFSFSCNRIVIDEGKFVFVDSLNLERNRLADSLGCVNYHNFVVHSINAVLSGSYSAKKIDLKKFVLSFIVDDDRFSARLSGRFYADTKKLRADDFEIVTRNSKVKFNFYAETGYDLFSLNIDNLKSVYMNVWLRADSLSFGELTKFIPYIHFLSGSPSVEVEAEGTLKNLKVKGIRARIYESDIFLEGELKNVSEFSDFLIDVEIKDSKIKVSDISKFVTIAKLPEFGIKYLDLRGHYLGHPLKFHSKLELSFGNSSIDLEGNLEIKDKFAYNLNFRALNLDFQEILDLEDLKSSFSFSGSLNGEGFKFETIKARISFEVMESVVNRFLIPRSKFWLELRDAEINGSVVSLSEGLRGLIDLNFKKENDKGFLLSLYGSLSDLDISRIRIDKPQSFKSHISGDFNLRFWGGENSRIEVFAQLNPSTFGHYTTGQLRLSGRYTENQRRRNLVIHSNMLDLVLEGEFDYSDLWNSIPKVARVIDEIIYEKFGLSKYVDYGFNEVKNSVYVGYRVKVKNLTPISVFLVGQIFQAIGNLEGNFMVDSQGFYFYSNADLKRIKYISYSKSDIDTFGVAVLKGSLELMHYDSFRFRMRAELNGISSRSFNFNWLFINLNYNEPELYAEISAIEKYLRFESVSYAQFSDEVNKFILKGLDVDIFGNKISILDEIEIFQTKTGIIINPASLIVNNQRIYVSGFIDKQTQQLRIWSEDAKLDELIQGSIFSGEVNLSIFIYGTREKPNSEIEVVVEDFEYKGIQVRRIEFLGKVEEDTIRAKSVFTVDLDDKRYNILDISVSVPAWFNQKTSLNEAYVTGKIKLLRFPISILEPIIRDISDLKGDISADIILEGSFDKPNFRGDFSLQNCIFKFDQNGKYYLVYGRGRIDSNVIYVEDFNLWNNPDDYKEGEVHIRGKIHLDGFEISRGDFNINGKLLVIDKEGFGNTGIYGRVIAEIGGGGLNLKIDTMGVYLDGEILLPDVNISYLPRQVGSVSQGTGFKYVYVNSTDTIPKENLLEEDLIYINAPIEDGEIQLEERKRRRFPFEFNYDLRISTLREAKLNVILNSQTGEEFFAEFTGSLNIRHYSGSTLAYGEINIRDRSYYNFFKRFTASGKLRFVGDLENPELDIVANYTGMHTVLIDTLGSSKIESVLIQLLITGTLSKPIVRIQMFIDGEDYQKVYPHGEVESDAISFLMTGRFKDELTRGEVSAFTENLWSSTGAGLLSNVVSGVITNVLRDILGGFITSTELGYYTDFKGIRITGNIGGAIVQIGGDIFTDISRSTVIVQYPLVRKLFGGSLTIEYQRKPVQFYQEKEILNKLGLYYRIRL